jgi:hypothetical protein
MRTVAGPASVVQWVVSGGPANRRRSHLSRRMLGADTQVWGSPPSVPLARG